MQKRRIARRHALIISLFFPLLVSSCAKFTSEAPIPPPTQLVTTSSAGVTASPMDWLEIYFTDPLASHATDYQGGPDENLAVAINQARLSVDVAAYSLNLWSIRNALLYAYRRGVVVRMVMESDNMDNQEVQDLLSSGIPIVGDQHEGLMHNKFIVIDRSQVWTGSMNFTVSGVYKDNNDLVCIHSSQVAEDFTTEFEEMFIHHLFGPDVVADTPYPNLNIEGSPVEIYFSPDDHISHRIVQLLQGAEQSINFLAYSFTSDDIAAAIRERAKAGVSVAGVMDDGQVASNQGTEFDAFRQAGLDVRLDGNQNGLMHYKLIIIDRKIVITGSYNFSASAEGINDENVVILFSPQAAEKYLGEFQRIYAQAQKP